MGKKIKATLTGVLGVGVASMVFCLPCWIPFLVFLNSIGAAGLLAPEYTMWIGLAPLVITSTIIGWLGSPRQLGQALLASLVVLGAPGYIGLVGYIALGVILWRARKTECQIVR